jgi:PAT family beta-lactamase induction signal transducer AmpG
VRAIPLRTKLVWLFAFYFASGFPYGLLNELLPVFFRMRGVSLADIGLLNLIGLPYIFKFLWAPALDRIGTRRRWLLGCQLGIAALVLVFAAINPASVSPVVWVVLVGVAVLSATQDVAVDAYAIELLDEREMGPANGTRVAAYRIALIVAGGLLLAISATVGWPSVFVVAGAAMLILALVSTTVPPVERSAAVEHEPISTPVRELLRLPAFWAVGLFILTFKLGDLALLPMLRPFWVDNGYSAREIGFVFVTLGMSATIAGALVGGALITRLGTFRALWMLGAVQALSNLAYYAAAVGGARPPLLYSAAIIEQFTGGMGTAAFLTFLMALCDKRYAATQYALLSAVFRLGGIAAASISGFATQRLGYQTYFLLTFGLALPAFALLPFVRRAKLRHDVGVET